MTTSEGEAIQEPFLCSLGHAIQWYDILQVKVERQVEVAVQHCCDLVVATQEPPTFPFSPMSSSTSTPTPLSPTALPPTITPTISQPLTRGHCASILVQYCPACFGGNSFVRLLDEGGNIHTATNGDCLQFYEPAYFLQKLIIESTRVVKALVPGEAIDHCQSLYQATDGKKKKAVAIAMDSFDNTGVTRSIIEKDSASEKTLEALGSLECGHKCLMNKVDVLCASINAHDKFPELNGIDLEFVCIKLHQQTWQAISKRQPALMTAFQKFNMYCKHLHTLYDLSWAIPLPTPLPTKLNDLQNDQTLIEDVWISPSVSEIPPWLEDPDVGYGICAVLKWDRCKEEQCRLGMEADNICRWFGQELAAIELALCMPAYSTFKLALQQQCNYLHHLQKRLEGPLASQARYDSQASEAIRLAATLLGGSVPATYHWIIPDLPPDDGDGDLLDLTDNKVLLEPEQVTLGDIITEASTGDVDDEENEEAIVGNAEMVWEIPEKASNDALWRNMSWTSCWDKDIWIIPIHRPHPVGHWVLCIAHFSTKELHLFDSFADKKGWKADVKDIMMLIMRLHGLASRHCEACQMDTQGWVAKLVVVVGALQGFMEQIGVGEGFSSETTDLQASALQSTKGYSSVPSGSTLVYHAPLLILSEMHSLHDDVSSADGDFIVAQAGGGHNIREDTSDQPQTSKPNKKHQYIVIPGLVGDGVPSLHNLCTYKSRQHTQPPLPLSAQPSLQPLQYAAVASKVSPEPEHAHEPHRNPPPVNYPSLMYHPALYQSLVPKLAGSNGVNNTAPQDDIAIPAIPYMCVIPPTPAKGIETAQESDLPNETQVANELFPPMEDIEQTPPLSITQVALGRQSDETNATLHQGIPELQITNLWNISHLCKINTQNFWNIYGQYFAVHQEREKMRSSSEDQVTGNPSVVICKECYMRFKKAYPDTWQEILKAFEEAAACSEIPQTIAQHLQDFNKFKSKLVQLVEALANTHDFEVVMMMAGSVVNQDASLTFVHTTPDAENFFQDQCQANNNQIMGNFKAHVDAHTFNICRGSWSQIWMFLLGEEQSSTAKPKGISDLALSEHCKLAAILRDQGPQQLLFKPVPKLWREYY
ncbi:hypothetical protein SERLADRAFT_404853 [Serpula lacrymans var. lacrymans S7.9]|uniref:Ubiquitin-like protease family profile domain-containing protein n=1 Tax=Serpula lacrymans var. lacrymans (strain S7.9) TaxID=578457 RepID=F8NFM8_SERL9|nr:uncharacterized protein SERLADRAFT_404853 [Serpula lacrymans var. lacrymans S7.9]EGO30868.1 hypothetical protein SERLADRAFT_404853 [Serpula lacrymans var. lacrymans S7.9]